MLNGDWRKRGILEHVCLPGCCKDFDETKQRMQKAARTLLRTLRPQALCKGNWTEWSTPLTFIGVLDAVHGLLGLLFRLAFKSSVPASAR
eukprot:1387105-Amphidinium_carterae.2